MPSRRKFQELEVLLTMRDRTRKVLQGTLKSMARLKKASFDAAKATAAIGAVSGVGFVAATRAAGKYGVEIQSLSSQLGITTDRFQELLQVAKLAKPATEASDLADSFKDIVERITEARTLGEGDLFDAASAVGLNLELTKSNEIIEDFVANMRQLSREEGLQRIRELAGDEAFEQMHTFIQLTNEEFRELAQTANDLGLIIKPETINNLAAMERALGVVKTILTTIAVETVGQFSAKITQAALTFAAFVKANGGALPLLEKVWERVTQKVNGFLLSLNQLPGVDLDLFGSAEQQQIAQFDKRLEGLRERYDSIAKFESRFTIQAIKAKRLKSIQDEIDKVQQLRDAIGEVVPNAQPFAPALQEDIAEYQRLVEQTLKQTSVEVPVAVVPQVKQSQEIQQLVAEAVEPPATMAAKSAGEKAGRTFAEAFSEQMQNLQNTLQGVSGIFDGIEQLQSANDARAMDRLNAMRSRNAAELDILKTRLAAQQNLTRAEIGLHNQRAAAIAGNNAKIDQLAARAELQACKRAKKFAVIQGALSVAAAWAGAAKAGAAAAGGGPLAYFAAYAPVLSAGLTAAANIAKFNCNSIGSTSGGVGGAGGGTGGGDGPAFNPTVRQGADLPSELRRGGSTRAPINITLNGTNFSAEQVQDLVDQINDGDRQIDSRVIAGVF